MKRQKNHIEALAALLLFALFALCILAVLFSGTGIYSRLSDRDAESFNRRSLEGYISTKLRQSDFAGGISVEDGVLILAAEEGYETRIYCHEGYIYELFTRSDAELSPESGESLLQAESMLPEFSDGLLRIELSIEGEDSLMCFDIRSQGVADS